MKRKKDGSLSFGIIFWIAVILLILVVFFINKPEISLVLERTKFFEAITKKDKVIEVEVRPPVSSVTSDESPSAVTDTNAPPEKDASPEKTSPREDTPKNDATPSNETAAEPVSELEVTGEPRPEEENHPRSKEKALVTTIQLYYLHTNSDGSIALQSTSRTIPKTNAPLTTAIHTLLSGPTEEEKAKGFVSLIPPNSQLLSAQVRNNIAYLSFNEAFRFNTEGREGGNIQLIQVILSATEFSTVQSVQFLIKGRVLEYLNSDGVFIGHPLGKQNLGSVSTLWNGD